MLKRGLVIFDIDGTLFDGRAATLPAVQHAFPEFGLAPPSAEDVQYFIGKTSWEYRGWLETLCPDGGAAKLADAVESYELDYIGGSATLYSGILEALIEIKAFVEHMAICSNGPQPYIERVLGAYDLFPFFQRWRYPQVAEDTKVRMVGELLEGLSGRPAVVVGDRGDDVLGAHENGILAIATTYGYGTPEELAPADAQAASPGELPGLIRSLFKD